MKPVISFYFMPKVLARKKFLPFVGVFCVLIICAPSLILFRPFKEEWTWIIFFISLIFLILALILFAWIWSIYRENGIPKLLINHEGIYENSTRRQFIPWQDIFEIKVDIAPAIGAQNVGFEALFIKVKNLKYTNQFARRFCSCFKWLFIVCAVVMIIASVVAFTRNMQPAYPGFVALVIIAGGYASCMAYLKKVHKDEVIIYLNSFQVTQDTLNFDRNSLLRINPLINSTTIEKLLAPKKLYGVAMNSKTVAKTNSD